MKPTWKCVSLLATLTAALLFNIINVKCTTFDDKSGVGDADAVDHNSFINVRFHNHTRDTNFIVDLG